MWEANAHSELGDLWHRSISPEISISVLPPSTLAGRLLEHCVCKVTSLRRELGGPQLCVYKIGITSDLNQRWASYKGQHFAHMMCIHASNNLSTVEHLEASLIMRFSQEKQGSFRNVSPGGEGMRKKNGTPRFPPPYFVYAVGANASQRQLLFG